MIKQNYKIEIITSTLLHEEKEIKMYGLKFKENDTVFDEYRDITDSEKEITELFSIFCSSDIDRCHIYDVICDYVNSLQSVV